MSFAVLVDLNSDRSIFWSCLQQFLPSSRDFRVDVVFRAVLIRFVLGKILTLMNLRLNEGTRVKSAVARQVGLLAIRAGKRPSSS